MVYNFELTYGAKEVLYGHLLGDGCLSWVKNGKKDRYYVRFSISSKHIEYINYITKEFDKHNIPYVSKKPSKLTREQYTWYNWGSRCFTQDNMKQMRLDWYETEGTKLPKDIFITPTLLRIFYIDDGYLNYSHGRMAGLALSLENMCYDDTYIIANLISIELKCSVDKIRIYKKGNGYIIRINDKKHMKMFFDYIGPCPTELINVFRYKWPCNESHFLDWRNKPIGDKRTEVIN